MDQLFPDMTYISLFPPTFYHLSTLSLPLYLEYPLILACILVIIVAFVLYMMPGQILPIPPQMPFPPGTIGVHPIHLPVPEGWAEVPGAIWAPGDKIFIVKR